MGNGRLAEIIVPTLILISDLDLPEKLELAAWLTNEIANAQHTIIPRVAYMLNRDALRQFDLIVLEFLTG